jgi:hypothetical protein
MAHHAYVNCTSVGDTIVIPGVNGLRMIITDYNISGNGNDQVFIVKSGGATGGQSNSPRAQFTVGPTAGIPGVTGQHNPEGHFSTIGKPSGTTPDDLVFTLSGSGTILLTGHITYELINS